MFAITSGGCNASPDVVLGRPVLVNTRAPCVLVWLAFRAPGPGQHSWSEHPQLERVGPEHAALDAGDVGAELVLTTAELLVELRQPLLALLERLRADEGLGL
jgi:hypothetical protein